MKSSVEVLYHFTCDSCKNWWSIAMEKHGWNPKEMWCPHCGSKQKEHQIDYAWFQQ